MIVPRQELLMSKEAVFVYTASMGIATLALVGIVAGRVAFLLAEGRHPDVVVDSQETGLGQRIASRPRLLKTRLILFHDDLAL
jgi:hypothetical protein